MILHDIWRILDRNAKCHETWRVGECHVTDTLAVTCPAKSWPGYVIRGVSWNVRLWYGTLYLAFKGKVKLAG